MTICPCMNRPVLPLFMQDLESSILNTVEVPSILVCQIEGNLRLTAFPFIVIVVDKTTACLVGVCRSVLINTHNIIMIITYLKNLTILYQWNDHAISFYIERWTLCIAPWPRPRFSANSKGACIPCLRNSIVCFFCVIPIPGTWLSLLLTCNKFYQAHVVWDQWARDWPRWHYMNNIW